MVLSFINFIYLEFAVACSNNCAECENKKDFCTSCDENKHFNPIENICQEILTINYSQD
jgi:hypothetical protein